MPLHRFAKAIEIMPEEELFGEFAIGGLVYNKIPGYGNNANNGKV
jgi:hypothetical protein